MNRRMEAWEAGLAASKTVEGMSCNYGCLVVSVIEASLRGDVEGEREAKASLRTARRKLEKAVAENLRLYEISEAIEAELDAKTEKRRLAKAAKVANAH